MNGEAAPAPDVGLLELVDCVLGGVDYRKNVRHEVLAFKRIVRFVPGALQFDERLGEIADFRWVRLQRPLLPTDALGLPVLEGRYA